MIGPTSLDAMVPVVSRPAGERLGLLSRLRRGEVHWRLGARDAARSAHALLKEDRRPADALRSAQLEMSRHQRWAAPFHWAGFVLQGDWR
jgi:hypothetical protein